jgi:hypothetical protein
MDLRFCGIVFGSLACACVYLFMFHLTMSLTSVCIPIGPFVRCCLRGSQITFPDMPSEMHRAAVAWM